MPEVGREPGLIRAKFPSLLGSSSAHTWKAALPWACGGHERPVLFASGLYRCTLPLSGSTAMTHNSSSAPPFPPERAVTPARSPPKALAPAGREHGPSGEGNGITQLRVVCKAPLARREAGFLTPFIRHSNPQVQGSPDGLWLDPKGQRPDLSGTRCQGRSRGSHSSSPSLFL